MLEIKENYIYYDNIINMVYSLAKKKNAELVRRMAFKLIIQNANMTSFRYFLSCFVFVICIQAKDKFKVEGYPRLGRKWNKRISLLN